MLFNIFLYLMSSCHVLGSKEILNIGGIFENSDLMDKIFLNMKNLRIPTKPQNNITFVPIVNYDVHPEEPFSAMNGTCFLVNQKIVGIFGPQSPSNIDIVKSICEDKGIPHVLTGLVPPSSMGELSLNLYPHPERLNEAYLDIVNFLKWEEITIIYTEPESLIWLSYFMEWAVDSHIAVHVQNIDPYHDKDYRPALKMLRDSGQRKFILDCPKQDLGNILMQIQQVVMMSNEYSYFLTNLDAHTEDFSPFIYSDTTIIGVNIISTENNQQQEVMRELCRVLKEDYCTDDQPDILSNLDLETALLIDAIGVLSSAIRTANVTEGEKLSCQGSKRWENGNRIVVTAKNNTYTGLTGMMSFDEMGYRDFFQLTIFQIKQELVEIGTWLPTREVMSNDVLGEISEDNFRDELLVVEIILNPPYAMMVESSSPLEGNQRFEGFTVDLIEEISKLVNFKYHLLVVMDGNRGSLDPKTGNWDGMIGDIINQTADMAIADLTITENRIEAVDFTVPFMTLGISILYRKPYVMPPSFLSFAEPFPIDFWIAFGKAYSAVVIALFFVGRISPGEWQKPRACKESGYLENQLTFVNCIWFITGSLLRQNTRVRVSSLPARIISAAWWMFCFVLVVMYIGMSISRSNTPEENPVFNNIEELLENAEAQGIKFGALTGGSTQAFFRKSANSLHQKVWQHMVDHPEDSMESTVDGVERAERENYAFFMESSTIEYAIQNHCNLTMYGGLIDSKGFGIAVKKDSTTLLSALSRAILKLQASGKLDELKNKWWISRNANLCQYESEPSVEPMDLPHFSGLMWITFVGAMVATCFAIFEFFVNVQKLHNMSKRSYGKCFSYEIGSLFKQNKKCITSVTIEDGPNKTPETVELK